MLASVPEDWFDLLLEEAKLLSSRGQLRTKFTAAFNKRAVKTTKTRRAAIRAILDELKNVPCLDCGRSFPSCVMDFDHIKGQKRFSISSSVALKSLEDIVAEIEKCEIICSNCHRIRTNNRRQKPLEAVVG